MKKFFQSFGIILLVFFSFVYTEKTTKVVREYDNIMIEIKKQKNIDPIDAIVAENTIIPGISGKNINEDKSYINMKQYGKFNKNLLVYNKVMPKETLEKNKNKFIISGNKNKRMVSLNFIVDDEDINKILKYNIKSNFFVKKISNFDIGNNVIGFYEKYDDWIKSVAKSKNIEIKYCFSEIDTNCFDNNLFVIKTKIIDNNFLYNTKKLLYNGAILTYKINSKFYNEFNLIINYINSKGYEIVLLDTLLEE